MISKRMIIAAAILSGTAALPALSHDHATGLVKERMDLMEDMGRRHKSITQRIRGKRDLAAIKNEALAIAANTATMLKMFPPGSTQKPTDAKATIWQNWAEFERLAHALETESAKLAETSPSDAAALKAQERAMAQTCSDCHEKFRVKQ